MKKNKVKHSSRFVIALVIVVLSSTLCSAQSILKEEYNDSIRKLPYFSIHKNNYFISGVPTNKHIDRNTANAKYQISFKQMISRDALPWDAYLFITYTQKAFWDIYKESLPFRDINFNPSVDVGKAIFNKNNELQGILGLSLEHESNGRDSIASRSWNRLTANYTTTILKNTTASFEVWLPFMYKENNADLLEYVGLGEINISHEIKRNKLYAEVMVRKGLNFNGKGVVRSRIYYNPFKRNLSNQYIMLEWYLGQAETLLDYQQSRSIIRLGYVIKSNEFNWFKQRK
ncbi:phospholipase A [Bizionia gelidisalsuginis]|uniref:Phosphatidylcholine 1-acylhydrolase n=1 Tax=Bizionia gelidisalsuginis TaxID=291188 RepID=A0ABY3MDU3_9FLAO|nr:phospholipase A [Bizionia gelidisalsuginis]TYC17144.1 phospholipase A [Bizionia gelidisalsuginis]